MAWGREDIVKRAAQELEDGFYVNLGIGMPTMVANHVPPGVHITLQSENGMLGMGPFPTEATVDPDLINAGKQTISQLPYSAYFDSAQSFGMIRGGHIDLAILGALQVSETADLANWMVPGKMVKGMGGAMDLVAGVKKIIVIMEHNAKDGGAKLVGECSLPLTGKGVVDMVITELGVFEFRDGGLYCTELAPDVLKQEVRDRTEATFEFALQEAAAAVTEPEADSPQLSNSPPPQTRIAVLKSRLKRACYILFRIWLYTTILVMLIIEPLLYIFDIKIPDAAQPFVDYVAQFILLPYFAFEELETWLHDLISG